VPCGPPPARLREPVTARLGHGSGSDPGRVWVGRGRVGRAVRRGGTRAGYSSGIAEASAIASAAGFAIFRRFGRNIPSPIHLSIS
jgi:hypothetical protein